jgi:hypothetical protein
MPDERETSIPPGLTRCPACGEYQGSTRARYFNWNEPLDASELDNVVEVSCLCEGISCRRCGKKRHRPTSNYYDERDNSVWHVPYFVGMSPYCGECLSRERSE